MKQFYRLHDKEKMPDGPWQLEPDKAVWIDLKTDLDCMINRNTYGALCGYVGVDPSHPFYGKDYSEIDNGEMAHGGLTYAAPCQSGHEIEAEGICHIPENGRSDSIWWFGFDCGHAWDIRPTGLNDPYPPKAQYRTFLYVQIQIEQLAQALANAQDIAITHHILERMNSGN